MNKFIFVFLLLVSGHAYSGIETDYDKHVNYAKGLVTDVQSRSNYGLSATDYCAPTDTACLNEVKKPNYKGASDVTISNDATTKYSSNQDALDIQNRFNQGRPDLKNDPAYTHAFVGQENAYEITHGISTEYADCDTGQICADKLEEQFCHLPTNNPVTCSQTPYTTHTTGTLHWLKQGLGDEYVYDEWLGWHLPWQYYNRFPSVPSLPSTITYVKLPPLVVFQADHDVFINGQYIKTITPNQSGWLSDQIEFSTNVVVTSNPVQLTYKARGVVWGRNEPPLAHVVPTTPNIYLQVNTKKHNVAWADSCGTLLPECKQAHHRCVEGAETRYWEGVYTYLPCWKYEKTYKCDITDTCGDLSDAVVLEESCSLNVEGICVEKAIRKQVTVRECKDAELSCGVNTFCLDGDCYDPQASQSSSEDFNKNVSALAALSEAAENLSDPPEIFEGKPMQCTDKAFGFADCCKDGGWGTSAGLAQCSASEEALGQAKEKKLTVYVGSFCARKIFGKCLKKKQSYCVFDSKLARIVQQDGRRQIGKNFGSSESPNCRGLSPDEMQRMNFDNMNFSDFYSDLNSNIDVPSPNEIQKRITTQMETN